LDLVFQKKGGCTALVPADAINEGDTSQKCTFVWAAGLSTGLVHVDVAVAALQRSAFTTTPVKVPAGLDSLLLLCAIDELNFEKVRREGASCRKNGEQMLGTSHIMQVWESRG